MQENKDLYDEYINLKNSCQISDIFLFKMSYLLNPYMSLRYHHFIFSSYEELGRQIVSFGPVVDVYLKDLLIYHLLSEYMEKMRDDKRYPSEYRIVKQAEQEALKDENTAYWTMGFKLGKTKTLIYRNHKFDSPEIFFGSTMAISDLFPFSSSFLQDKCVLSWLSILGYTERIKRFLSIADVEDEKEDEVQAVLANDLNNKLNRESQHK
jgi:hypothetical protein